MYIQVENKTKIPKKYKYNFCHQSDTSVIIFKKKGTFLLFCKFNAVRYTLFFSRLKIYISSYVLV